MKKYLLSFLILISGIAISQTTPNLKKVLSVGNDGNGLQIKNIADPTANQDAATKSYVDASAGGGGTVTSVAAGTNMTISSGIGTVNPTLSTIPNPTFTTSVTSPKIILNGATSGSVTIAAPATAGTNTFTFPAGTTNLSTTGGTGQVLKQSSVGGAITVGTLSMSDISDMPTVSTGTYTPTCTAIANVSATSAFAPFRWVRIGQNVVVYGLLTVDIVSSSVTTQVNVSTPITSAFTTSTDCFGFGNSAFNDQTTNIQAYAIASSSNVQFLWQGQVGTASYNYNVSFNYIIK